MYNFPVKAVLAKRSLPLYTSVMHSCCPRAKMWLTLILQNDATDPLIFNLKRRKSGYVLSSRVLPRGTENKLHL